MRKTQSKTIFTVIVIVAIMMFAFAAVSFITSGFTKFKPDEKIANEDNFYTQAEITLKDTKDGNGVTINIDDNGAIKLGGKSTASDELEYTIGTVTLDQGSYTLMACSKASFAGVYVTATAGSDVTYFDFTPGNVLNISTDDTVVTLTLVIAEGATVNNIKVLPVIYTGDEAIDFYK